MVGRIGWAPSLSVERAVETLWDSVLAQHIGVEEGTGQVRPISGRVALVVCGLDVAGIGAGLWVVALGLVEWEVTVA